MNDLKNAFEKLVSVCSKYALTGHFNAVNELNNLFPASLPRSEELDYFYKRYNPEGVVIETGLTPIELHSVNALEKSQAGYGSLPDNYLVIGDDYGGGKPLIAVVGQKNTPVYASYDVAQPFKIADSLSDFILSLANLIELVYGRYNIFEVFDDNDEIKEEFTEELQRALSPVIGNENFVAFFDYFYG